jgi:hypothetical protein
MASTGAGQIIAIIYRGPSRIGVLERWFQDVRPLVGKQLFSGKNQSL